MLRATEKSSLAWQHHLSIRTTKGTNLQLVHGNNSQQMLYGLSSCLLDDNELGCVKLLQTLLSWPILHSILNPAFECRFNRLNPWSSPVGGWEPINSAFECMSNHLASTERNSTCDSESRMLYLPNWDSSGSRSSKSCRFSALVSL